MNWRALGSVEWLKKAKDSARTAAVAGANAGRRAVPAVLCGLAVAAASQTLPACSTSPISATAGNKGGGGSSNPPPSTTNACEHPSPGCACATQGATAACGKVIIRSGASFQCEMGTTTCDGSTWGECDGSIKVQEGKITGGGVALQGLGSMQTCGATNPCDPNCFIQTDTPPGLDGGAGITVIPDAGLTLAFTGTTPNICSEPTDNTMTLQAEVGGSYFNNVSSLPIPCTGGGTATDSCPFDYFCNSGTCAPYAQGTTNAACINAPDFTMGVGCYDSNNPHTLEWEVCNRGNVAANSGTLTIDFLNGVAPTLGAGHIPAGCDTTKSFPDLLQAASGGYCTIALPMLPIAPGECINFQPYAPPANITCTGVSLTGTGNIAAVVNPPMGTTFTPASTPLAECDVCNNYTTFNQSAHNNSYAACVPSLCGTSQGSGGAGVTCTTTISGTVMDPGSNVGLSNVAVYVATSAPTMPLQDQEPNGAGPYCDSCMSLSTPGYLNAVATAVDGTFSLPVSPGPLTVVAQIGRWRRVTSVDAVACTNTAVGTGLLNMPKDHTQGDIPRMAIVEGSQESAECWLARVGVSTSEFAPYAPGNTNRIDLYTSTHGPGQNYWNGSSTSTPMSAATLWANSSPTINNYAAVLLPCDGSQDFTEAVTGAEATVQAYANAGGRVFINHWVGQRFIEASGLWSGSNVASWQDDNLSPGTWNATVNNGSPDQKAMYDWLAQWDSAACGAGCFQSAVPRDLVTSVGAKSVDLADFNAMGEDGVASFWFNTPIANSAPNYCGRVVYNDMHVSASRSGCMVGGMFKTPCPNGGGSQAQSFPQSCDLMTALTSEEKALEYELFQLGACNLGTTLPVTIPAPPTPLTQSTFTRIYNASCPKNYTVKWGFFQWQDVIPSPANGAQISFTAQTAPENAMMTGPAAWGAPVNIGVSTVSTPIGSFGEAAGPTSVDSALVAGMQTSQAWLQVKMTLTPNASGTEAPVLTTWQQLYDCVP